MQSPSSLFLSDRFNIDLLNELLYLARKEFNIIIADVANRTDNIYLEMLNLSTTVFFLASAENTQIMRINMFLNILQNGQKKGIIVNDRSFEKPDKKLIKNISGLSEIPIIGLISGRNESRLKFLKINGINTGIIDVREQITELLDYVILS